MWLVNVGVNCIGNIHVCFVEVQAMSLNVSVKSVSCVGEDGDVEWHDVGCVHGGWCSESIEVRT